MREAPKERLYDRKIIPPQVNMELCGGCEQCVRVCPVHVFDLRNHKSVVARGEACIGCGHCWAVCPEEAVTFSEDISAAESRPGTRPAVDSDVLKLLLRERRSVRLFTEDPVSKGELDKILDAGRYAPSACNSQNVNYLVLPDRGKVDELRSLLDVFLDRVFRKIDNRLAAFLFSLKYGRASLDVLRSYSFLFRLRREDWEKCSYVFLPHGPAVIVACAPSSDTMAPTNCAVSLYNCLLMAHSLGLGACFLGSLHLAANADRKIGRWLRIPEKQRCYGAIIVGHPDIVYQRLPERQPPRIEWL